MHGPHRTRRHRTADATPPPGGGSLGAVWDGSESVVVHVEDGAPVEPIGSLVADIDEVTVWIAAACRPVEAAPVEAQMLGPHSCGESEVRGVGVCGPHVAVP